MEGVVLKHFPVEIRGCGLTAEFHEAGMAALQVYNVYLCRVREEIHHSLIVGLRLPGGGVDKQHPTIAVHGCGVHMPGDENIGHPVNDHIVPSLGSKGCTISIHRGHMTALHHMLHNLCWLILVDSQPRRKIKQRLTMINQYFNSVQAEQAGISYKYDVCRRKNILNFLFECWLGEGQSHCIVIARLHHNGHMVGEPLKSLC